MSLKVRHLHLIRALARERSVTGAARSLRLSQPAVSHGLRELEELCGQLLFERSRKGMEPTPGGRRLLEAADQVLGLLDRACQDLEMLASGRQGVLRVATECYTGYPWLPPVLARFRERYPLFDLRIVVEATQDPVAWLRRRELDLAITLTPVSEPDLCSELLFQDELVAVVAPAHPWAGRPFVTPEDFAEVELMVHSDPRGGLVFREFLAPAGIEPRRISQLQLTEAVVAAVRCGLGVSALARWVIAPEFEHGTLIGVPLSEGGLLRQWSATRLAGEASPAMSSLIELLKAEPPVAARRR